MSATGAAAGASGSAPTRGGVGATPTPANNVGGGSGLGDPGFFKGSSKGVDDKRTDGVVDKIFNEGLKNNPDFSGLEEQRKTAHAHGEERFRQAMGEKEEKAPASSSDGSFMKTKPGEPDTLPGWNKIKEMTGSK